MDFGNYKLKIIDTNLRINRLPMPSPEPRKPMIRTQSKSMVVKVEDIQPIDDENDSEKAKS